MTVDQVVMLILGLLVLFGLGPLFIQLGFRWLEKERLRFRVGLSIIGTWLTIVFVLRVITRFVAIQMNGGGPALIPSWISVLLVVFVLLLVIRHVLGLNFLRAAIIALLTIAGVMVSGLIIAAGARAALSMI